MHFDVGVSFVALIRRKCPHRKSQLIAGCRCGYKEQEMAQVIYKNKPLLPTKTKPDDLDTYFQFLVRIEPNHDFYSGNLATKVQFAHTGESFFVDRTTRGPGDILGEIGTRRRTSTPKVCLTKQRSTGRRMSNSINVLFSLYSPNSRNSQPRNIYQTSESFHPYAIE